MSDLQEQIQQVLDPIVASLGLTLWDLEFRKEGPQWLLRIYIEREAGGVTLNDCESVSRDLGAVLAKPRFLPFARRRTAEHLVAQVGEPLEAPAVAHREPNDAHTSQHRFAGRQRVSPGDVIPRAGGQDGDVVPGGEPLRQLAAVRLRAPGDVGAVSLDDERELHRPPGSERRRTSFFKRAVSRANS